MVGNMSMNTSSSVGRRLRIIHAAYDTIAEKGFEGLRLRVVAAKAGIDHSTLHHYFATKNDLVESVLDYATEQFRPPQPSEDNFPTPLFDHLSFLGKMIAERCELHTVMREFDLRATRDRRVESMIRKSESGWRQRLSKRVDQSRKDGHWPKDLDSNTSAEMVIAIVKGASFSTDTGPRVMQTLERLLRSSCDESLGREAKR
jgi:AcrR family transcriptional regulator